MNIRLFCFLCTFFICTNAFAVGDSGVVLSMAGECFVLVFTACYILIVKQLWRRKIEAFSIVAMGGLMLSFSYRIPDYLSHSRLINVLCIGIVMLSVAISIFVLRNGASSIWKFIGLGKTNK